MAHLIPSPHCRLHLAFASGPTDPDPMLTLSIFSSSSPSKAGSLLGHPKVYLYHTGLQIWMDRNGDNYALSDYAHLVGEKGLSSRRVPSSMQEEKMTNDSSSSDRSFKDRPVSSDVSPLTIDSSSHSHGGGKTAPSLSRQALDAASRLSLIESRLAGIQQEKQLQPPALSTGGTPTLTKRLLNLSHLEVSVCCFFIFLDLIDAS